MPKPWRTLIEPKETGRFTREQVDEAVRTVMERKARRDARAPKHRSAAPRTGPRRGGIGEGTR